MTIACDVKLLELNLVRSKCDFGFALVTPQTFLSDVIRSLSVLRALRGMRMASWIQLNDFLKDRIDLRLPAATPAAEAQIAPFDLSLLAGEPGLWVAESIHSGIKRAHDLRLDVLADSTSLVGELADRRINLYDVRIGFLAVAARFSGVRAESLDGGLVTFFIPCDCLPW